MILEREERVEYNRNLLDSANLHDCAPNGQYFPMKRDKTDYAKGVVRMVCKNNDCPRSTVAETKYGAAVEIREPAKNKGRKKNLERLEELKVDEKTKHLETCKTVRESELPASRAQRDLIAKDLYFTDLGPKKYAERCIKREYVANEIIYIFSFYITNPLSKKKR